MRIPIDLTSFPATSAESVRLRNAVHAHQGEQQAVHLMAERDELDSRIDEYIYGIYHGKLHLIDTLRSAIMYEYPDRFDYISGKDEKLDDCIDRMVRNANDDAVEADEGVICARSRLDQYTTMLESDRGKLDIVNQVSYDHKLETLRLTKLYIESL